MNFSNLYGVSRDLCLVRFLTARYSENSPHFRSKAAPTLPSEPEEEGTERAFILLFLEAKEKNGVTCCSETQSPFQTPPSVKKKATLKALRSLSH